MQPLRYSRMKVVVMKQVVSRGGEEGFYTHFNEYPSPQVYTLELSILSYHGYRVLDVKNSCVY